MSQELKDIQDASIIKATGNLTSGDAHIAVDFFKILKTGLNGYLDEISSHHKKVKPDEQDGIRKDHFYNALTISIKGIGCAGHIRFRDGIIITTSNLKGYKNYPLRDAVQTGFKVPIILDSGRYLGIGLYNIFQALNPPLIVLGGGLLSWGDFYLDQIRKTYYELARDMVFDPIEIKVSKIGPDAGVIGAASLALELC
jgi:predicted NBD/HSP70 family sugar kinase